MACAQRGDVKQKTPRDMRTTTSQHQQLCSVPGRKCMYDQNGGRCAGTKTGNLHLAAVQFLQTNVRQLVTCCNTHTLQVMFSTAHHEVPLFQPRSTLLSFQRRSGPAAILVRTYHYQNQKFDDNQSTCWATHFNLLSWERTTRQQIHRTTSHYSTCDPAVRKTRISDGVR